MINNVLDQIFNNTKPSEDSINSKLDSILGKSEPYSSSDPVELEGALRENPNINLSDEYTLKDKDITQSDFDNWWNNMKQAWDNTQKSTYQSSFNKSQLIIDNNNNLKEDWIKSRRLNLIDDEELNSKLSELEEQNLEAAKKRDAAEEGIKTNEQEIANEYVSKTYKLNEAIVNAKGANATYGEAFQYTVPSGLGSMGSMMVSTFIATVGKKALTRAAVVGLETAGVTAETGPGAAVAGGLAFLGQMAIGAYARYSETEAELGDNVEGIKQELIKKWFEKNNPTGNPSGPQPSEYDLRQIRIQSMNGVDELMKENYALFAEDALGIVIGSSMFKGSSIIKGLGRVGEYNKYARIGKALGFAHYKTVGEKFEEGLQHLASGRQRSKALGLEEYEDKGFMSNLLADSYDTATSINLGLPYQEDTNLGGKYSEDKEFQAASEVGGMLGLLGGGSAAAIKITRDISKYLETSKDLKDAGAVNTDDKVFRLKNQIYQKNFEKNSVPFLLEGIRNLRTVKNEMGEPMMNDEQAAEETRNILNAYDKYKQVSEHLEGIKPAGFAGVFQSKEQTAMLNVVKQELFHTSMEIARNSDKLPILASLDNIRNLIDNQQRIVDSIKETKDSSPLKKTYNLSERLKIAEAKLNQLKLNKKMIMERDGIKEKELPEASSVEQSNANKEYLINDLNLSELKTKYDNLLKIKTNEQLNTWFVNHAKGIFEKMKESNPNMKEGLEETEAETENSTSDLLMPEVELSHAKEFKTKFKGEYDSLLVELKDKKGIVQKLDHLNKINAVLQKAKAEVDKHVKTFLNSPTGEHYKSVSEKLSKEIEVNNQKIKNLDVKNKNEKTNPSVKIIDAVSKLTTMFVGFLDEAQLKELDEMSQIDILNSAEIRIEDYENANNEVAPVGLDGKPIENTNVKIILGLNSEKNKGKGVYVYVNGKRIGGLMDPRRFVVAGKPFNPGNMKHLAALNPDFVQKNENGVSEPTAQGEAMQNTYAGLVKAFEALEEKGSFTNDEVQEYFYVNRTGSIEYVKGEKKPTLGESLSNKGYEIEYSFKNSDDELVTKSGVIIIKFKNESISNIYLRNVDGTISEIVRENSPTEFSKIESIYNERHNEIKKGLESKYGNDNGKGKLTGQFFALINNPSAKSKLDILSASFPSIETDVTEGDSVLTNLSEMIIAQDKKIIEAKDDDIIDGVTLTSNEGNFFISASGISGVKIEIGMTGMSEDKRANKKEDDKRHVGALQLKISLPGVKNNITLRSKQKTSSDEKKLLGKGELNLIWGEDEDGSIILVHQNPVTKKSTKITTSAQLLSALNTDIKLYASRKSRDGKVYDRNKKLEKLKLEGFKLAVDEESSEGDFNSLNNMKMNAIPVRSSVSFKPKKVEAPKSKAKLSEVNTTLAINQINSFIDDIGSANKINLPLFYSIAKAFIKENGLEKYSDALDVAYEKRLAVLNEEAGKSSKSDSQIASNEDQMREIQLNIDEINSQLKLALLDTSITKAETDALKEQRDELQEQLRALGMNGSDRNSPFKIGDVNPTSNPIDIEVAKARLKKMLPNWISTELVDTIAHNLGENGEAWGRFMDNIVYISKSAKQGVEYHEAFHAVFRTILTRPQYKQLISEAKIKYEKYTEEDLKRIQSYYKDKIPRDQLVDLYYEEKMADEFQKYAEGKESRSLLTRIFDAIKALGRFFFDNRPQMDIVFSNIYNGVYKNSEPVLGILRRSETPAFKLIPKADKWNEKEQRKESGFLSQSQSERIINTIAMNVIKRTNVPTPEIIKEEVMKMVNYYDVSNFSNELRQVNEKSKSEFDRIYNSIQEVSDALKNTKTQSEIAEAVEIRTALFNYEDVNEKENTEDDANDDGYVFNQSTFTIGGWGSLSKEMKQFMAFTEVNVDEFGFKGLIGDEEMKSKKFNMASNGFVIYTGVERALADTPKNKILKKLIMYSNQTEHAKAFKDNLIKVISNELGVEVDENTSIDILKNSDWFNKFASTFVKNKVSQAVVVFDPETRFFKAFKSNQRDESTFQVDEWSKAYIAMGRNKEMNRKDNIAILEALNTILYSDNYIAGKDDDGEIKPLGSTVSEFINIMKKLGIELSSGYVRFSLIANKIDFIESKYNKALESGNTEVAEYFKGLMDEFEMFDDADPFTSDDIEGLTSSLDAEDLEGNKSNNPFAVLVDNEGNVTDTGAIGRMKNIAANNAIFDESVTGSTFQNAKGDTVFDKILPSYLTSELAKWRDEARREFIRAVRQNVSDEDGWRLLKKAIEADGGYMEDYLVKTFYQSIKNNPLILGVEYEKSNDGKDTNKIIYNDDFSDLIFDNIKTYIADGLRAVSFNEVRDEDEEGGDVYNLEEESYKRSTGNTYANLDPRTKTIMAMSLFARGTSSLSNDNNKLRTKKKIAGEGSLEKRSRTLSQFIFAVIETKSTQNMVTLPVQNFVNNDGTLNSLGMDYLKRSLVQEYERIGKAEKEIKDGTDFFLEGFHNKEERGLAFFNFSYLKSIDETLYNKMVDSAKAGLPFSDINSEVEDLLNKFYKEQFDKWVDLLVKRGAISKKESKEGVVTYENKLLPNDYQDNNKNVNMKSLADFFSNDYLMSININNLLHGDLATSYSSHNDVVKRNAKLIGSGPTLGSDRTTIAVVKSVNARDRADYTEGESNIDGLAKTDTTDAQNLNTLDWYQNKYLKALGKSNSEVKRLISKIRKGYKLSWSESQYLIKSNASITSRKIVGGDTFFYDKTSTATLLRSVTSFVESKDRQALNRIYDLIDAELDGNRNKARLAGLYSLTHNYWKPMPNSEYNHYLLNKMEISGTDILAFDSSMKQIKPNVSSMPKTPKSAFDFQLNNFDVSDSVFREQVNTDAIKKYIIHPTQLLNLIWSEQDRSAKGFIFGKEKQVGEIADAYLHFLGKRVEDSFKKIKEAIIENNKPKYKELLKEFQKSLDAQNSDPYIQEFFKMAEGISDNPKYNLNFPATLVKFENMWLSYVSKAMKIKTPGHKFTLKSDFGDGVMHIGERIITDAEFRRSPSRFKGVKVRKLAWRKQSGNEYVSECKISAQFAEQYGLKIGDKIPEALARMFGVRIPTQDKHSMVSLIVVDFLPAETGNIIMLPLEIVRLSGADFDIDSLFARIYTWYNNKYKNKVSVFGDYLKEETNNNAIAVAHDEYLANAVRTDEQYRERLSNAMSSSEEYNNVTSLLNSAKKAVKNLLLENKDALNENIMELVDDFESRLEKAGRDAFEFDEDGNYVESKKTSTAQEGFNNAHEKKVLKMMKTILSEDSKAYENEVKTPLNNLIKEQARIREELSNQTLELLGYKTKESEFSDKFGKQVSANRMAFESGSLEDIVPFNKAETDNILLEMEFALLHNNSNLSNKISASPSTTKMFDDADNMLKANGINVETKTLGVSSPLDKSIADENNSTGAKGIGPAAVFNVMFQRLNKYGIKLIKGFDKVLGHDSFGSYINDSGQRINDGNSSILSVHTDNAKDPKAGRYNISQNTIGAVLNNNGMGIDETVNLFMSKQEIMSELNRNFDLKKSEIASKTEKDFTDDSIAKYSIKAIAEKYDIDMKDFEIDDSVIIDVKTLTEALKFSEGLQTDMTKNQFLTLQKLVMNTMLTQRKYAEFLRNMVDVLGLLKGMKKTWAESDKVFDAIKKLGIEMYLKKSSDPNKLDSYDFRHVEGFAEDSKEGGEMKYPFDLLPIFKNDKLINVNMKVFKMINIYGEKFFITRTPLAEKIKSKVSSQMKPGFMDYEDNRNTFSRSLISYLTIASYRNMFSKSFKIDDLFNNNLHKKLYSLLSKEEFKNNEFLKFLNATSTEYSNKRNKSIFEGLTLYKLEGNTRTKNNPDFVTLLMDGFRQLNSSLDDEAKDFTVDAFNYLVMKDGLQFKNNSFIRQIEPYFLSRMTSSLDIVQDLLSNDKTIHSFRSVFGVKTQDEVMNNFVTLFTSDRNNNFGFKYLNSPDVSKNMKANVVKSLNSPEELAKMTKEEKNEQIKDVERADLEKNAPLFFTADKNGTRIMKIDLSAGVEGDESRKEKSRLWTANKSSLLSFKGMFEYRKDGIALPLVFIYNNILGNGIKFKNYYKLVSYTVKVDGKDVTYKADNFNGKDMHEGYYAIYEEFKPWGSQETSVYPFSPKEWESFSAGRELEIAKAKEESKKLEIPEKKTILSNPIEKQKNEIYDFLNSEKASTISPEQKKDIMEALKNAKTEKEISEIIQTKIC
jgi:hypothetical protein